MPDPARPKKADIEALARVMWKADRHNHTTGALVLEDLPPSWQDSLRAMARAALEQREKEKNP